MNLLFIIIIIIAFVLAAFLYTSVMGDILVNKSSGGWLPNNVKKEVQVETPFGVALLYLYKKNIPVEVHLNEIMSYKLRPQNNSLINATFDTIFVSDIPSLKGYTFTVRPVPNSKLYIFTRLT